MATIINAYFARPLGSGPFPGVVLIYHAPGWDEWYRETTRKFAHHGNLAISPRRNNSPTIAQRATTLTICTRSANRSDSSHPFSVHMRERSENLAFVQGIRHESRTTPIRLVFLEWFQPVEDLVEGQIIGHL
jgi:hypothetical protein